MKRQILRVAGIAALAAGGLLASGATAQADSGSSNGNRFTHVYQHTTVVCGNAVAIEGVVHNHCNGSTGIYGADLDGLDGILDLNLDFLGDDAADDAGQWFHIDSRTWS
jgi:hypothetical protein